MPTPDEVKEGLKDAFNKTVDGAAATGRLIKKTAKAGIKKTAQGAVYAEEKIDGLGDSIKGAASSVGDKISDADLSQKASDALNSVRKAMPSTEGITKGLSSAQKAVTPEEGGKLSNAAKAVTSAVSSGMESLKGAGESLKGARKSFSDNFSRLKSYLVEKMNAAVEAVTQSKVGTKVSSVAEDVKKQGEELKQQGEKKLASVADSVQQNANNAADKVQKEASNKISPEWKTRLKNAGKTLSKGATTVSKGVDKAVKLGTEATAAPGKTVDWAQRKFNKAYDEAKSAKSNSATPSAPTSSAENKRNSIK